MGIETTRLTIDLPAIVANWQALAQRHATGPVAGVVKADAYGLGAAQVVAALFAGGCRHFFAAHLNEAIVVAALAKGAMVAALNGLAAGTEDVFEAHGILPVLGSLDEIDRWSNLARRRGRRLSALLHIDTGMNRLGLHGAGVKQLAADPRRLEAIDVRYVMTHLAAAEVADDPMNATQSRRFVAACAMLPKAPRSLANSSGIFLGADFGSDLARPGAALYGLNPIPGHCNLMRPVVRLVARVLALRDVSESETIGYNGTFRACRASRIATVSVGYADGWLRSHSNQGYAIFDGAPLPLVGRVSMDLTTFDATDHPTLAIGDWLELIGPSRTPDDVAAAAGTNGYEILTALGRRYTRTWIT